MEELKAGRRSGEGSPSPASMAEHGIFVSDIARGVTDQQLKEAFASVGQVVDALVVKNKLTGETKGYGFVKFATPEAVEAALALPELPTFRDAVSNKVQMVRAVRADPKNVLYVGNLPCGLAAEDDVLQTLQEVLTSQEVVKFKLCKTPEGGSKGYGWATFRDHQSAVQAMRLLQMTPVLGIYLTVHLTEPRKEDDVLSRVKSLFVRGVLPHHDTETMKAFFGEGCEKVVIPFDNATHTMLGHAFVHFNTRKQAEDAMLRCQNTPLDDQSQPFSIEWCLPKEYTRGRGRDSSAHGGDWRGGGGGSYPSSLPYGGFSPYNGGSYRGTARRGGGRRGGYNRGPGGSSIDCPPLHRAPSHLAAAAHVAGTYGVVAPSATSYYGQLVYPPFVAYSYEGDHQPQPHFYQSLQPAPPGPVYIAPSQELSIVVSDPGDANFSDSRAAHADPNYSQVYLVGKFLYSGRVPVLVRTSVRTKCQ